MGLTPFLKSVTQPPFEPMATCPIRLLSYKVAFLVGITSARQVSELAVLSMARELCHIHHDRIVIHTRIDLAFMPKVNSLFHRSQEVILPSFCPNLTHPKEREWHMLDVRNAISFYLDRTFPFQRTEVLFMSYMSHARGLKVSPSTISQWVREAIATAYHTRGATPPPEDIVIHHLCSAATSVAFKSFRSLKDVCRAATWSSPHMFIKHYKVDTFTSKNPAFGRCIQHSVLSHTLGSSLL